MDYICYLSRSKVDQLYEQVEPRRYSRLSERITTETMESSHLGVTISKVLAPFNAGITYGRKNSLQMDGDLKQSYITQLREVLLAIYSDQGDIPELSRIGHTAGDDSVFYYHEGVFTCKPLTPPVAGDTIAEITSSDGPRPVTLTCTLRNFSESTDQTFIHSGNYLFFRGATALTLAGVIVVLDVKPSQILGSPLYLKLAPPPSDRLRDFL